MSDTITALFDRDPLDLTDQDIDGLIGEFRARRAQYLAGNQKAGKVTKPAMDPKAADDLLKDLGL